MKKKIIILFLTSLCVACFIYSNKKTTPTYQGSSFSEVWTLMRSTRYETTPEPVRVTKASLFKGSISLFRKALDRSLVSKEDLLPHFNKLAHPNGVCLAGTWKINKTPKQAEYTGLFTKGSEGLIIARASVSMSNVYAPTPEHPKRRRSMSLAGKIFPTLDMNSKVKTANFVLAENIGGSDTKLFTEAEMLNKPGLDLKSYELLAHIKYVTEVFKQSNLSDDNSKERQVYSLAEANLNKNQKAVTPKWMKIIAKTKINDKVDFREELNFETQNNKGKLKYEIYVANQELNKIKNWELIGEILFTESALSDACDHRLHFNHDKWREDLDHGV